MYDHTDELKDYRRELVSLLPWLGPHIAKRGSQGSAFQILEHEVPITMMVDEDSLQNHEKGWDGAPPAN